MDSILIKQIEVKLKLYFKTHDNCNQILKYTKL
jgi:hypothetical protein